MAQNNRTKFRQRLDGLFSVVPKGDESCSISDSELHANWAKYLCVLTSGYLEQSVKEIVLEYAALRSQPEVIRYIDKSWAGSKNMRWDVIADILDRLDSDWSAEIVPRQRKLDR